VETRYRVDADELQNRIRLAAAYKRRTGGELLPENLFDGIGEEWRPKPRKDVRDRKYSAEKAREKRIQNEQQRRTMYGPTWGISIIKTSKETPRFRVAMSRAVMVDVCPITVAVARNKYYAKAEPGIEAYQIPLEAVFKKWGCRCGKHKKGEDL
jgi:hypothetical protein